MQILHKVGIVAIYVYVGVYVGEKKNQLFVNSQDISCSSKQKQKETDHLFPVLVVGVFYANE